MYIVVDSFRWVTGYNVEIVTHTKIIAITQLCTHTYKHVPHQLIIMYTVVTWRRQSCIGTCIYIAYGGKVLQHNIVPCCNHLVYIRTIVTDTPIN